MTTIEATFDKKIDNIQHQLDVMHREGTSFRGYVNRQFELISREMVTKEDLGNFETRMASKEDLRDVETRMAAKEDLRDVETRMASKEDLRDVETRMTSKEDLRDVETRMASKDDLRNMEARMRVGMATKDDLSKLTEIVVKIAEKVGVSA